MNQVDVEGARTHILQRLGETDFLKPRSRKTETGEYHPHARNATNVEPEHLITYIVNMRCGGHSKEYKCHRHPDYRLTGPTDKLIKSPPHPCADVEKQEVAPQGNTHEAKGIDHQHPASHCRGMNIVVIARIDKGRQSNSQRQPWSPPLTRPYNQHIEDEELKEHECEPIASLQRPQLLEELWRRCQQQQEDKRGQDLHHELMAHIG